jgi:5-methylthioadenosine/S-adenosylhomocysteine deaminase
MANVLDRIVGTSYVLAPELILTPKGPVHDHVLVVKEGRIAAIEKRTDPAAIVLPDMAIVPGMIDCHAHAGQTFGKSLIGGEPTQIWRRIWIPLEDALTPERSYVSAKWMFLEALRGGFTTLVNFNRNSPENNEAVHQAAEDCGIRLVSGVAASSESPSPEAVIADIEAHIKQCSAWSRVTPSLCFGFYAASLEGLALEDLAKIGRYCADNKVVLQMHSNEHFPDVHDCIVRFGKRPVELWDELGILGPQTLLHHATLVSANEIDLIDKRRAAVSYNPVASQWKGNAVAPALHYAQRKVRMGLGTDNTRLDGFRMMDAAENCQRIAHGMSVLDFSAGGAWTWVDAATRGGADACGLGERTGALQAGYAADFLLLDMTAPEVVPSWDFEWELVRAYDRDQVRAVAVDGRIVMRDRRAVGWDSEAFVREQRKLARDMVDAAGVTRVHAVSSTLRPARQSS